jgi:hypothetical protein
MRTRVAVSVMRAAILSNRARNVASSDAANLVNLLRQVEADRANLDLGRFLQSVGESTHHSGRRCRSGAVHPIRSTALSS